MKLLLSAFACAPNAGSEGGVGWRWAIELAKANHEVIVLTDITREAAIARELDIRPVANLTVVFYRPNFLRQIPLNSLTAQILYSAWQYSLLPFAKALHRQHKFELIIHLTYGVFRHPSFLGFVGPQFVFGPVGGGEDAPWHLKESLPPSEKLREAIRSGLNVLAKYNPFLQLALNRASLVLTKTTETRDALPKRVRERAKVFPEIGITAKPNFLAPQARDCARPFEVLFAGRLLGWKGAHLAIRAVASVAKSKGGIRLTIVGNGPLQSWLVTLATELAINEQIRWIGQIPQAELFELYGKMHCFLFPSLHDSSGNVVLEALSYGLPVVCLDLGGPMTLVNADCATIVSTTNSREHDVVEALASALKRLISDESLRLRQSKAAIEHAAGMNWASRVDGALNLAKLERESKR